MNPNVDALQVIDQSIQALKIAGLHADSIFIAELVRTRAAVGALTASAEAAQDALLGYDGHVANPMNAEGWSDQGGYEAYVNLDAAIGRVRGWA